MKKKIIQIIRGGIVIDKMMTADAADFFAVSQNRIHSSAKYESYCRDCVLKVDSIQEMNVRRRCVRCGTEFKSKQGTAYCDTCREKRRQEAQERWKVTPNKQLKVDGVVPYEKKSPLAKVAWDARQHGMTYGQYVGRML